MRRICALIWAGALVPIGEGRSNFHQIAPASFLQFIRMLNNFKFHATQLPGIDIAHRFEELH
jgi:hypothetical protein